MHFIPSIDEAVHALDWCLLGLKVSATLFAFFWFCATVLDAIEDVRARRAEQRAASRATEAHYQASLRAASQIGATWPPKGMQ